MPSQGCSLVFGLPFRAPLVDGQSATGTCVLVTAGGTGQGQGKTNGNLLDWNVARILRVRTSLWG